VQQGEQCWFVDTSGKNPFGKTYFSLSGFANGTALVNDGKKYMTINRKGETVYTIPEHFQFGGFDGGRFIYLFDSTTQKINIINPEGKSLAVTSFMPTDGFQYMNNTIIVVKNIKDGVINYKGEIIIPDQYNGIKSIPVLNGWFVNGDYSFFVDEKGNKYITK
jgi:hypothetical protein